MDDQQILQSWNEGSDNWCARYASTKILDQVVQDPWVAFPRTIRQEIQARFPSLAGKRVLVPSSGDNIAVFAFHLLGAQVVSTDFSQKQLDNAKRIADARRWTISFLRQNSMELADIPKGTFDLVYASNGVHVWISRLDQMYAAFYRALREGGSCLFFETHPFIRPFDSGGPEIKVKKDYDDTAAFGDPPNYHWRVQDLINHFVGAGFRLEGMEEFHGERSELPNYSWWYDSIEEAEADSYAKLDWQKNAWAALPQWIALYGRKGS